MFARFRLVAMVKYLLSSATSVPSGVFIQVFPFVHIVHQSSAKVRYTLGATLWHLCVYGSSFYNYAPLVRSKTLQSLLYYRSYFILEGSGLLLYRSIFRCFISDQSLLGKDFFLFFDILMLMFNCSCCCLVFFLICVVDATDFCGPFLIFKVSGYN